MSTVDELLRALDQAASQNRQDEFDRLEDQLVRLFEGGLRGMPREVYDRYLAVDRSWPAQAPIGDRERPGSSGDPNSLGPKMLVSTRLPAVVLDWLHSVAQHTGTSRSQVLTECVRIVRSTPEVERALVKSLRDE